VTRRLAGLFGVFAALVLVAAVGPAARVDAHADLVGSEPAADSKLKQPPASLVLHFSQAIKHEGSFILIEDAAGNRLPLTVSFDDADGKVMRGAPASPLPPGVYKVLWQTLSDDDDDFDDGSYQLTVLNPDGSDPEGPTSSVGPEISGGGSDSQRIILVVVSIAVVVIVGGIAVYLQRSNNGTG
jgi:methionine-rich copper-binding protein CopC